MTHIDPDDPKWTAYVLGELDDEERAAVELELEESDEAKLLVEELRFAASLTKTELGDAVPAIPLTRDQRENIRASANTGRARRWFGVRDWVWISGAAAAAAAALVLAVVSTPPSSDMGMSRFVESRPAAAPAPSQEQANEQIAQANAERQRDADFGLIYVHPQLQKNVVADKKEAAAEPTSAKLGIEQPADPAALKDRVPNATRLPANSAEIAVPQIAAGSARVFGKVQDASAAVMPGATVTATNVQTGEKATTVTNDTGAFEFEGLKPGNYKLEGALPGFQTAGADNVPLEANTQAKQDITLQVAAAANSVEVAQATGTVLNTSSSVALATAGARIEPQIRSQSFAPAAAGAQPTPAPPASRASIASGVPRPSDRVRLDGFKSAESYDSISDNPFQTVAQNPLSTFSIDVDTESYSNVRRFLSQNQKPPRDAVRIEEMINYFSYDYPQPAGNNAIGASIEAAAAPWNPQHRLVRIGIKGRELEAPRRPADEARKVVDRMSGTLVTVAKDVKIQVEFNEAVVDAYRLIGYENRALRSEDFNNDLKDAGDLGAGHTFTVLYEVVPRGVSINSPRIDALKSQPVPPPPANASKETLTLKIRYKEPTASDSKLLAFPLVDRQQPFARASVDLRFAAAVASFGMILRQSPYKGTSTIDSVLAIAKDSIGSDRNGYRREFLQLVQRAR
jgi:hypothetical protein